MSVKSTPHDLADRPYVGAPVKLPRVLLCHATPEYRCGRAWVANTWERYTEYTEARKAHQTLCEASSMAEQVLGRKLR